MHCQGCRVIIDQACIAITSAWSLFCLGHGRDVWGWASCARVPSMKLSLGMEGLVKGLRNQPRLAGAVTHICSGSDEPVCQEV